MKKMITVLFIVAIVFLSGCEEQTSGETFEGTVVTADSEVTTIIVEPDEDEDIRRSGTLVTISVAEDHTFQVGDTVLVTHEGEVMESHPLQINLLSIEKTSDMSE